MKNDISGVIFLDKDKGISSNKALQKTKFLLGAKKAGHAGSLDPLASGMLPVFLGEATKFSQYLLNDDKTYEAEITLGYTSSTGDAEGVLTKTHTKSFVFRKNEIEDALAIFIGEIRQVPPMYSALKHQGQPLYKLARAGKEIARKERKVQIYSIQLLDYSKDNFRIKVKCSKGTYIRTLVEDIGKKLGVGAFLANLRRLAVGNFTEMHKLQSLEDRDSSLPLVPIREVLSKFGTITINDYSAYRLVTGQGIEDKVPKKTGVVQILNEKIGFIGLGEVGLGGKITAKRLMTIDPQIFADNCCSVTGNRAQITVK